MGGLGFRVPGPGFTVFELVTGKLLFNPGTRAPAGILKPEGR